MTILKMQSYYLYISNYYNQKCAVLLFHIINYLQNRKVVQMTKAIQAASDYQRIVQQVISRDFKQSTTLAPMQVKLEKIGNENQLRQVHRENDSPDKIQVKQIYSILQEGKPITCLSKFKKYQGDQLINGQNQRFQFHPKLVVCVCAYNEDKQMLQETLKGIYLSLTDFQKNAGIKTQEIVVLVIFDGIQNVKRGQYQEDMITFFDQVDYTNGSVLKQGEQSFETLLNKGVHPDNIDWRKTCSMRESEIEQNLKRRFRTKYDDYMNFLKIKKQCQNKNKTYEVEKLIPPVRKKYNQFRSQYIQKKTQEEIMQYKDFLRKIFDKRFTAEQLKSKRKQLQLQFQQQFNLPKRKEQVSKQKEKLRNFHSNAFDGTFSLRQNCIEKAYKAILDLANKYFDSRKQTSLIYPIEYRPNPNYQNSLEQQNSPAPKLNVLLCIKHKNAGKLSSHALFFLGFCEFMRPDICLLMDVGLQPLDNAIYKMYEYMDKYQNTGGVCGYMGLKVQKIGDEFGIQTNMEHLDGVSYLFHQEIFSVQKAQLFQYHMGHLIDKPFEAAFNFIHVLPGAFSCYRYQALAGNNLSHYLQPALEPDKERTLEERNMFLAQDRTLSLVLKQNNRDFAYLPTAKAVVDPASSLVVLMGQRRRWINGSWYAFFQVFGKRQHIHDLATRFQFLYYYFIHGLTYISISLFYVSLFLTVQAVLGNIVQQFGYSSKAGAGQNIQNITTCVICFLYIVMNGGLIFLSLQVKNNDKRFQKIYYFISFFLGCYGLLVTALMLYNILILITSGGWNAPIFNQNDSLIPNTVTRAFMIGTIAIYGIHVLFSFNIRIMLEMLGSTIHYIFYAPTYLHILMIYAFCKIDDFSWGTKGLETSENVSKSEELKRLLTQNKIKKYFHVYKFMGINTFVALVLVIAINYGESKGVFVVIFSGMLFAITVFRFLVSNFYLLKYYLRNCNMSYTTREREANLQRGNIIQGHLKKRLEQIKQETKGQIIDQISKRCNCNASTIKKRLNKK